MSTPEILKAEELADMLGCSVTTVEEKARQGQLPGLKFGDGGWVFPTRATFDMLNSYASQCPHRVKKQKFSAVLQVTPAKGPPPLPTL